MSSVFQKTQIVMKTKKSKRPYSTPRVQRVKLDNEISLVMSSLPKGNPPFPWGAANTSSSPNPFRGEELYG